MAKLNKEQIEKVNNFLMSLIELAVKAVIDKQGSFTIENEKVYCADEEDEDQEEVFFVGDTDYFSEDIESKYEIQILETYQSEEYDIDHTIGIELKGSLAEKFLANGIETKFDVLMESKNREPRQTIYDAKEFRNNLRVPTFSSLEHSDINDFDGFYAEITKPYLSEMLKGD